jgi:hypothetical protein
MKFSNKKHEDTFHVYPRGYGKDTTVNLRFTCMYDEQFHCNLDIEDAIILSEYLNNAIESAKEREKSKREVEEIE